MTSLRTRVCIYLCLLAWTDHLLEILNKRVYWILILRRSSSCTWWVIVKGYCQSSAPVKLKHTWQLTACLLQIINSSLPTGRTISITTVVKRSRVRTVRAMPKRQKFSSCHEFSVKLSLCICSHTESSCPNCWHMYAIPGYLWWRLINISTCVWQILLCA